MLMRLIYDYFLKYIYPIGAIILSKAKNKIIKK